jgi:hypothetical protein
MQPIGEDAAALLRQLADTDIAPGQKDLLTLMSRP